MEGRVFLTSFVLILAAVLLWRSSHTSFAQFDIWCCGLSTELIIFKPSEHARLEVKNTAKKAVTVQLQFVDKDDQILEQRDVTIAAGATEKTEFLPPDDRLRNPKGLGDLSLRAVVRTQVEPNGFLEPTLRIIENKSGNIISTLGPARFNPKGPHVNLEKSKRQLGPSTVPPDAPRKSGAELAAAYESILSQITAPNLDRFKSDFTKLKSLNDDLASRLDRAPKSANFDKQRLQEELKTILKEKDFSKLEQRIGEFRNRYEQQLMDQLTAAGIDVRAERQRAASLINLEQQQVTPEAFLNAGRMVAVGTVMEFVDDRPPVKAAPLFYEDPLAAPFISAGTRGAGSADRQNGNLASYAHSLMNAGSRPQQNLAFVGQSLLTRPGARRLHVSVSINDLNVYMGVTAIGGNASAESAINLRVFDDGREVASRRVNVGRLAAALFGINSFNRRFPTLTLGCEIDRTSASASGDYWIVVEFETLAASSWFADAMSSASGKVGPFTVRTY